MCGICGIRIGEGGRPTSPAELSAMSAALAHRGPDGSGLFVSDEVGLASTRLSIVDLATGFQPLRNEDETLWLVANGEIFNHRALRATLERRGHRFRTGSDCETIVHGYEEWGADVVDRIEGQFAFALWDTKKRRLLLARDPVGIIPLYYARAEAAFIFASEAKAIFATGRVRARLDADAIASLLVTWGLTAPRTAFDGIRMLRPGSKLVVADDLSLAEAPYWALQDGEDAGLSSRAAADRVGEALERSVALRISADVEVGSYLSGGLDSAVVTALAARRQPGIRTFGVGFDDPALDETPEQRRVARALGTNHLSAEWSDADVLGALARVVWHCEAPLLRLAPLPLAALASRTRAAGIKVVVSGEGADEVLGGYDIFKEARYRAFLARDPGSPVRAALAARLHAETGVARGAKTAQWTQFFARGLTDVDDPFFSHRIRWANSAWSLRLLAGSVRDRVDPEAIADEVGAALPADWAGWPPLRRAQALEIVSFMSSYLLSCQGDRVAMASGVEVRYPYLDRRVIETAFALPARAKTVGLRDKVALRRFARRLLPAPVAERPKQAYRAHGIASLLAAGRRLDHLLEPDAVGSAGVFDPAAVSHLAERVRARRAQVGVREQQALNAVLTTQLLAEQFISSSRPTARIPLPVVFEDRRRRAASGRTVAA